MKLVAHLKVAWLYEDLLSMVVEGRRTAAAESISLPVAFEIKESFPTSASIMEHYWSMGVKLSWRRARVVCVP